MKNLKSGVQSTPGSRELDALTERIIGCAYEVSNRLGIGFVEKVYENALAHENGKRLL